METDSLTRNGPRHRRRGPHISPTLLCVLALFLVGAIAIAGMVIFKAEQRANASEALWINLQTKNGTAAPPGCETTIMLYRHCEKYGPLVYAKHGNQHCSYLGRERAHFIPTLFGPPAGTTTTTAAARWPNPSFLYALSPDRGGHYVYRQIETLTPLATKLSLTIHHQYKEGQELDLARELFGKMQDGTMCGKTTLVSWTHRSLPQLAGALGCPRFTQDRGGCPSSYPVDSFDQVWSLKFVYEPATVVLSKHEKKQLKEGKHGGGGIWTMYPTVTQMNFDPLAFSHAAGDYPEGGTSKGGNWSIEL